MNNNFNMMNSNQYIDLNNFNQPNQLLMNQNMNQIAINMNQMNPNMNQMAINMNQMGINMNQINPNMNLMNPNMYIMNQNMNPMNQNMNINIGQNNQNMIFPNMIQISQNMNKLNINNNEKIKNNQMPFSENNFNEEIEDVLSYIYEPKMVLKFSNINTIKNGTFIRVKLPKSLTKAELYTIAKKYQVDYYSNIILSCDNYLLKSDDSSIDGIKEDSIINIIEDADFPDSAYYNALMKKNEKYQRIGYFFKLFGKIRRIEFPKNITVSELNKAALSKLLLNSKKYKIEFLKQSNSKIINEFPENKIFVISMSDPLEYHWKFGKILIAETHDKENNYFNIDIGNLNSIDQLISRIEIFFGNKKLKKIIINGNEFLKKEIKNFSLKSIGINDNFNCLVEYK